MKITRIIKKGARDVVIHFENDEKLILAVDVFLKSGLKKFDDISDDRFFLLIEKNKKYHIKNRAFRLLGRRHHSTSELKQRLWQKDYDKKLIDAVVEELVAANYLNDEFNLIYNLFADIVLLLIGLIIISCLFILLNVIFLKISSI